MCGCHKRGPLGMVGWILIVIGGINWGLVGLGGFFGINLNVVDLIFGGLPALESLIYVLVGIATLMVLFGKKHHCEPKKESAPMSGGMNQQSPGASM